MNSMKKKLLGVFFALAIALQTQAQDANNPIDPAPTFGLWNRFYGDDFSRLQALGNVTYEDWFFRVTAEYQFNYDFEDQFKGTNFMAARLFELDEGKHQLGLGAIVSYIDPKGAAGGVSAVSVSKFGGWKFITLTTLQGGNDIFTAEFQPGIYYDFSDGWYFRSHPRMLFDFEEDIYEIPVGAGFGRVIDLDGTKLNMFFEPQYDLSQDRMMLYTGFKLLF